MFTYRRLTDRDLCDINAIQQMRGFPLIAEDRIPPEWIVYGAYTKERKIAAICCLFVYSRLPHSDYPGGRVAELGACYTCPQYRHRGVMTKLIRICMEQIPADCGEHPIDAVVADASSHVIPILREKLGFEASVSGELRVWKALRRDAGEEGSDHR